MQNIYWIQFYVEIYKSLSVKIEYYVYKSYKKHFKCKIKKCLKQIY